jgi:hypothetical protein
VGEYPLEEFLWGFEAGVVALALAAGLAAVVMCARPAADRAPVTGVLMGVAALLAIAPSHALAPGALLGLAGVTAVAGLAAGRRWAMGTVSPLPAAFLAVPFAWLLATDASSIGWVRAVVLGSAAAGAVGAARTEVEWSRTGLTPVLYVVSAGGVFAAVPNTQEAAALLGASVPGALVGWPLWRGSLGGAGGGGAAALLVWVAAIGALGREPALLGAVACLGMLATLPTGRWLAGRWSGPRMHHRRRPIAAPLPILVVHVVVVAVASRVAGVSHELRVAVPVAVAATVSSLLASVWLQRGTTSDPPDRRPPAPARTA